MGAGMLSWHFPLSNCCFRASQKTEIKKTPQSFSRASLTLSCFQKGKGKKNTTWLVPLLKLLLIIFCYKFLYMCQLVVEIFTAVPLLAIVGISLQRNNGRPWWVFNTNNNYTYSICPWDTSLINSALTYFYLDSILPNSTASTKSERILPFALLQNTSPKWW